MVKKNRNRGNRKKNKRLKIVTYILILILLVLMVLFAFTVRKIVKQPKEKPIELWTEAEPEEMQKKTEMTSDAIPNEESESREPEIVYQQPAYKFQQEEVNIEIPGLKREYKLAWVSDVHMITDKVASDDVMEKFMETVQSRYDSFQTGDGVSGEKLWPEIVRFLNYEKFDGIILGGDIMDYCSDSNMDSFIKEYKLLNDTVPLLYIRADHDYGFWYGGEAFTEIDAHNDHTVIDGDKLEDKYLDFGEFLVIGVNGSTKNMTPQQYKIVDQLLEKDKPVIIATHVPYESKVDSSLEALSMKVKNKVYYWGGEDYIPYEPTNHYFAKIYSEDTNVCQVLAGHLHASWDGMITEQVSQHIFSPAFNGTIGVIHVIPDKEQ